jgi:hypothetical protein
VAAVFAAPTASASEVGFSLAPAAVQGAGPYRDLRLSVRNHSTQPVRAVSVRMGEGGPAYLFPLAIPPEANSSLTVPLPVFVPEQTYVVRALAGEEADSPVLSAATVATSWPAERVSPIDFIDPQLYARHEGRASRWPEGFLRELFLASGAVCAALLGVVLLRSPGRRLSVVLAIAAASAAGILIWADRETPVAQYTVAASPRRDANGPGEATLVVSCLRTTEWRHPSALLIPIYRSPRQMLEDDAVAEGREGMSLTIHSGEMRIFRVPNR